MAPIEEEDMRREILATKEALKLISKAMTLKYPGRVFETAADRVKFFAVENWTAGFTHESSKLMNCSQPRDGSERQWAST
jgi:hypothetical protein